MSEKIISEIKFNAGDYDIEMRPLETLIAKVAIESVSKSREGLLLEGIQVNTIIFNEDTAVKLFWRKIGVSNPIIPGDGYDQN